MKILRGGFASRHDPSFILSRPYGQANHVILLLRSKAEYWINGQHYLLKPGYALIIAPETPYRYHNPDPKGCLSDDWLHFLLEEGDTLADSIPCNIPFLLDDFESCSTIIRQILWEQAYTSSEYADSNINALFLVLWNHLSAAYHSQENIEKAGPYLSKLKNLRLEMQNTPMKKHNINKYAEELCISVSHFQYLYSHTFSIPFQNDLIQMRVSYAKILLRTTDFSVEQISEMCGYTNCVHFFRQFKQIAGITPAKYRKVKPAAEKY